MSVIKSACLNGHDPYAYLKDTPHAATDAASKRDRATAAASVDACPSDTRCVRLGQVELAGVRSFSK